MTLAPLAAEPMTVGEVVEELRRLISAGEFKQLIVSHRRLTRADEPHLGMRGLRDLDSGEHFLVEERKLYEASRK